MRPTHPLHIDDIHACTPVYKGLLRVDVLGFLLTQEFVGWLVMLVTNIGMLDGLSPKLVDELVLTKSVILWDSEKYLIRWHSVQKIQGGTTILKITYYGAFYESKISKTYLQTLFPKTVFENGFRSDPHR